MKSMSEEIFQLTPEEAEKVNGGFYRGIDYEGLIEETDKEIICCVCGLKYNKPYGRFVDMIYHLKEAHNIDKTYRMQP